VIFGIVLLVPTIIIIEIIEGNIPHPVALGQKDNNTEKYDIVLLSHIYNRQGLFADEITGRILNNGTATIKAVEMTAIFYDDEDDIIDKERSGTSPYTIPPGETAAFAIKTYEEPIKVNASSYDFTAKWQDQYLFSSYFTRLTGGEISGDINNEEEGEGDEDDGNN
jgi:hypothetical protein